VVNFCRREFQVRRMLFGQRSSGCCACRRRRLSARPTDTAASAGYAVENWQAEQGLPRSSITAIAQTADGYLWLGSPYGLMRFDGVRFVLFEEQAAREVGRGDVRDLHATADGTLWIGTRRSGTVPLLAWRVRVGQPCARAIASGH